MLLWGSRAAQFSTTEWNVWLAFFKSRDIKDAKGTAALLNWRSPGNSLNLGLQSCVLPVQSLLVLLCTISTRQGPREPWTHSNNSCDLRLQIYPAAPREESNHALQSRCGQLVKASAAWVPGQRLLPAFLLFWNENMCWDFTWKFIEHCWSNKMWKNKWANLPTISNKCFKAHMKGMCL